MVNKVEVETVAPRMMDVPNAAKYIGCGKWQVFRMIKQGKLPCVRYSDGARPKRYIAIAELDKFLEKRMAQARADADPHVTNERLKALAKRAILRAMDN